MPIARESTPQNLLYKPGTLLEDFQDTSDWTNLFQMEVADDSENFKVGDQGIKFKVTALNSYGRAEKIVNLDLSEVETFALDLFCADTSLLTSTITLYFSSTTNFSKLAQASFGYEKVNNGYWTRYVISKSDFTFSGGESWNNMMIRMRIRVFTTADGFSGVTLGSLYKDVKSKPYVLLTVDDVFETTYSQFFNYCNQKGIKFTADVYGHGVGMSGNITLSNLQEIYAAGNDVISHTYNHVKLSDVDDATVRNELNTMKQWLTDNGFNRALDCLVYPNGGTNVSVESIVKELGFKLARAYSNVPVWTTMPFENPYLLKQHYVLHAQTSTNLMASYEQAVLRSCPIIFTFHQITDNFENDEDFQIAKFKTFIDYLVERKAEVVTMSEFRDLVYKSPRRLSPVRHPRALVDGVYGVSWDKGASPILTRTDSAVGLVANAGIGSGVVQNNFDNVPLFKAIHEVTDDLGNVFIRIPKLYIRKTDSAGIKTVQVCGTKRPGFYRPWCFWDFTNGEELPYIDVGKHKASLGAGNKLESKPNLYPLINKTIVDFRTYARNNNVDGLKGYQQLDGHVVDVLQTLFRVEFATLNSQAIMQGFTTGQYTATHLATVAEANTNRIILANAYADLYRVGQAISVGTTQGGNQIFYGRTITAIDVYDASDKAISFDGTPVNIAIGNTLYNTGWKNGFASGITATSGSLVANDGKYPNTYRGIESITGGDLWQFVDGYNINERQAWIAKNAAEYASNVFASPYEQLGYVNGAVDGYSKEMGYDPNNQFAELPSVAGGASATYYSDYYYQTTGQRLALFGGGWHVGAAAGLSCWSLWCSSSAGAGVNVGGRLLKKPL